MKSLFGFIGRAFITFLRDLSSLTSLFGDTIVQSVVLLKDHRKQKQWPILQQVDQIGFHSLLMVLTVSGLFGIAMTVLIAIELREIGDSNYSYIPGFVTVAIFRGVGPLLTAVIVAGRVGAAFTARIGTMKVSEEILALETMAINPVRFLVVQRFLGLLLSLPVLTMLAGGTAVFGSFLLCSTRLGIRPEIFLREAMDALMLKDLYAGVIKATVFAMVIALIGCYRGLLVEGGAEDVGRSTMITVVTSTLTVIVLDTVLTAAFYG